VSLLVATSSVQMLSKEGFSNTFVCALHKLFVRHAGQLQLSTIDNAVSDR